MPKVTVINPVDSLELSNTEKKQRVCAYCRVSSDSSEQLQSFNAQVEHYTAMIQKNPQWQFCGVYADQGISGTDSSKREELQRLLRDCETGKIDMVITKSISRLARNTTDSIEIIRRLKLLGIGIYFEKESVNTLSAESELVLTILSSVAQEESISISQNNKWSCRKRFQSGEWVPSYLLYGYTLDSDENIVVQEAEAEVVRRIFNEYLNGRGAYLIAKGLTEDGIPTRRGSSKWSERTVMDILQNEKYTGDLLMQKTFTTDTIPFIRKRNKGQKQKYLIEDNHEPVISTEQAQQVNEIKQYRKTHLKGTDTAKYNTRYLFSSRIICGECGNTFIRRTIFKDKPYQYIQWSCGHHIRNIEQCGMKAVKEEVIKQAYIRLFNKLKCNTNRILTPLLEGLKRIIGEDAGEQIAECNDRINELNEQSQVLHRLRSKGYIDSVLFIQKSNAIETELEELRSRRNKTCDNTNLSLEIEQTKRLISTVKSRDTLIGEFDEKLFGETVKAIKVKSQTELIFALINGLELTEHTGE